MYSISEQFNTSVYAPFLKQASTFYEEINPELAQHFERAAESFTMPPRANLN